ncbi:OpgC domain-containing protein [uncultured Litoreibacter sp.]|uniref:OpgC family protein n=1 Tax=uncultured Litoreibacter sp. TaxID=1392394 RepID=UPI002605BA0B|nr:OpgC domain-containing protein [uncultured Litoreibacter sp.]
MTLVSTTSPSQAAASFAASPSASGTSGVTTRDPRLDFYRGIAMFIILFAHTPGNFFTSWIPARWGFSDATEIFVFCSGMASAIAFGRTFDRAGWVLGTARVAHRVWQVYWAHICMFFTIAMMIAWWDSFGIFDKNYINSLNLVPIFEGRTGNSTGIVTTTADNLIGIFTLSYVPNYFDILPMYMVILVMMPMVMALSRVNLWLMAAVIATVWLFAQRGVLAWLGAEHLWLSLPAEPWSNRHWFFNPFGWQLIFFTGFAFMRGWIPAPPVKMWLVVLAAVVVVANIPLSNIGVRAVSREWFGAFEGNPVIEWRVANKPFIDKSSFGLLRYVHFLALAYLAWVAAGVGGHRLIASGATSASKAWGALVKIVMKVGQQSLAVFVFSMVFARISGFTMDQVGRETATVVLVNFVGVGALIAVAYFVGWIKSTPWKPKKGAIA